MFKNFAFLGAISCALALSLSGCNSTSGTTGTASLTASIAAFNTQVQADLPTACALLSTADTTFQTVGSAGQISAAAVKSEKAAMAGVASICANPSAVSAATALPLIANAYVAVVAASK